MAKSNAASAPPHQVTVRDFLSPEAVVSHLKLNNKKDVLQDIAHRVSKQTGKDEHVVFDVLWARECLGTTGVGRGIAIPHGRVPGLEEVTGYFARMSDPIAYEAIDEKPVDLVFLLLSPEDAGADHLQALAMVSRLMRDEKLCDELRRAKDENALYRLLVEAPISATT